MALEGPAILALITIFGVGMVLGAFLARIMTPRGVHPDILVSVLKLLMSQPQGGSPNALVALEKATQAILPGLEQLAAVLKPTTKPTGE